VASWSVLQRRKKKEERRGKEEDVVNLAEIHLNFEKLKI
jgi:hypothetical protein